MTKLVFILFISYLIGSISASFILGKYIKGIDIRNFGSGNAGTTNAMRIMGRKLGSITFFIDFLKGYASLYFLSNFIEIDKILMIALFCVLGHNYPFYLNFKGGKGIATSLGCFFFISPILSLIGVSLGVLVALISKYVSLGSIIFLLSTSLLLGFFKDFSLANNICLLIICFLGIYRHKSNILKIKEGKENKIGGILWIK